jgi:ribosomal protein S18 acetylase RimI-like enzyme
VTAATATAGIRADGGPGGSVEVRPARPADLALVGALLAASFDDDPVFRHLGRRDPGRAVGLRRFFRGAVRELALDHGDVHLTADGDGVAVWVPPGIGTSGVGQQLRLLPSLVAAGGIRGLPRMVRTLSALEPHHPHEPHAYLMFLGVAPGRQGRGIGSALLRTMLERCDTDGRPAYLEASSPRNRALYERHGFVARDAVELPGGGPPIWPMWREPSAAA